MPLIRAMQFFKTLQFQGIDEQDYATYVFDSTGSSRFHTLNALPYVFMMSTDGCKLLSETQGFVPTEWYEAKTEVKRISHCGAKGIGYVFEYVVILHWPSKVLVGSYVIFEYCTCTGVLDGDIFCYHCCRFLDHACPLSERTDSAYNTTKRHAKYCPVSGNEQGGNIKWDNSKNHCNHYYLTTINGMDIPCCEPYLFISRKECICMNTSLD
ncbi:hypothetical protein FRACYDRAFT_251400 [Fragilariopsis cylindrus CCMP1102]|uniref:Uncharacterized protein n=1 Tax=Fragilariopsis cylindrus CCMP1102 TaxID=635003 RepID=A0A1E7EMZ9_9STRA|nr:hypothetical protein FRACYDRAFT_251400 [Fragilariopsis cylindrus CCMP1102]|eukprot:OEU07275.1 hypothetical protein FRACYDRAFT_251400 [Fragilariopsis cylindrus CCMP1102]